MYMLREREFIRLNENVYKIGRTAKTLKERLKNYPKGSEFILFETVNDSKTIENLIINMFKIRFIQKDEYGCEYFEGDKFEMIDLFQNIVNDYPYLDVYYNEINNSSIGSTRNNVHNSTKSYNKKLFKPIQYDQILAEINESDYNFKDLLIKQSKNKLTEEHKLVLKKIFFNKTFGIKCTSNKNEFQKFFNKYHNKEISFKRFENFFGYIDSTLSDNDDESLDNFNDGKDKVRHKIIIDLINRITNQDKKKYTASRDNAIGSKRSFDAALHYKTDDFVEIIIDNKKYTEAIKDIINNSIYFSNENENRALFFKSKGKKIVFDDKKNHIGFTKFIQSLFINYGIILKTKRKRVKGTKIISYVYHLNVDPIFLKIADYKHKKTKEIDIYKDLFIRSVDNKIQKCTTEQLYPPLGKKAMVEDHRFLGCIVNLPDIDIIA